MLIAQFYKTGLDPFYDPNYGNSNDETARKVDPDSRIKAGITAGAVSGSVVIVRLDDTI